MGEKNSTAPAQPADIGKMLSLVSQDSCDEAIKLRKIVSERFDYVLSIIQNHPQLPTQIKRCLNLNNPTPKILDLIRRRILCIITKRDLAAEKSNKVTTESDEQELFGNLGTRLQGLYSNQWFDTEQVSDFQETAVQFIDALNSFYYLSDDEDEDTHFGDLLEDDDEEGEVGRMLNIDDMNNLKIIVSAVQTYFDYIESERNHIKSTKDERNIFNKEMKSGRIFHIRNIADALRAILFESYLCECINQRAFKYTDDTIRKLIVQWDKYRMEVHFPL